MRSLVCARDDSKRAKDSQALRRVPTNPGSQKTCFSRTAEILADIAAKDEQRSKKERGTGRDRAAVKLHGLMDAGVGELRKQKPLLHDLFRVYQSSGGGQTGMMPLSCNGLEASWPHRQDACVTLVSYR